MRRTSDQSRIWLLAWLLPIAMLAAGCGGGEDSGADPAAGADVSGDVGDEDLEAAREFFRGKTMTFVVDRSPGGGYDAYARMVAPYLAEQLGAEILVENQPGAGGLVAMNNLIATEPDGLTIATFNAPGLLPAIIGEFPGAEFGPEDLTWIGRMAGEPQLAAVSADSEIQTFDDLLEAEESFSFGGTGPGSSDFVNPNVLIELLDLNAEVIAGFEGGSEVELAVLRGDVDVQTGTLDSRLPTIENGEMRALVALTEEPIEALPDTPTIFEYLDEEQAQIMRTHLGIFEIGRPVVAPPGVDPARVEVLREALDAALQDPDLLEDSREQERPISYLSGEEQTELALQLADAPEPYREVLAAAFENVGEIAE